MAVSQVFRLLWITGIVFGIFPHLNLGLLSDYKICGDSECESLMSRVQAIRDHHGKDCRFLSFRRGDTIFVYHKLTGKREDLWAGTIDKRFGYFPKDAVQEEQVYATVEKVVETQRSDFFCMDESGYLIDSSDLDSDTDANDQKIKIQESESTQTVPHTDGTNTESPPTSADPSTDFPVPVQQTDDTTPEGDESKNAGEADPRPPEEAHENPAALNEQGGSSSSSWLGSSVTGWLGLGKEEEYGGSGKEEKEDERKETQDTTSLTSSVTGWLGLGKEEEHGSAGEEEKEDERKETQDTTSLTSSVTGWLGLGKEEEHGSSGEEEKEGERKETQDKTSLTSSVTGWLGFGGEREPDDAVQSGEGSEETTDSFTSTMTGWLGFGGEPKTDSVKNEQDGETEMDEENELQVKFRSRRMSLDLEGSQLHEEEKKEMGTLDWLRNALSDGSKDNVLPVDAASMVDQRDAPPQTKSEEKSQDVGGMSSMIDEERPAELEADEHQIPKSTGNESEDNNREPGEEEIKTVSHTGLDLTLSDVNSGSEFGSADLDSDSTGPTVGEVEGDEKGELQSKKTGRGDEEGVEIVSAETGASGDPEGEGSDEDTDILHRDISTTPTDESAEQSQGSGNTAESSGTSLPFLSSGTAEERNEPVHSEDQSLPAHCVKTDADISDTLAMTDGNMEKETHRGELGGEGGVQPVGGSSQESTTTGAESLYEKASEQESVSPQVEERVTEGEGDIDKVKETEKNTESNLHQVQTETDTLEFEKDFLTESGSEKETETGEGEEPKEKEKQEKTEVKQSGRQDESKEAEEIQEEEKQQEMEEQNLDEAEGLKENEKRQGGKDIKKEGEQEEVEELKEEKRLEEVKEVEEIKEEGRGKQKVEGLKEEEKREEVEEAKEDKNEEVEELKEEKREEVEEEKEDNHEEMEEAKEEKQEEAEGLKEEEKREEVEEEKEDKNEEEEELKEEEEREEVEEEKEDKHEEMEEPKEEKQEEVEGLKEEEKREEVVEEGKEDKNAEEELKEEEEREEVEGEKEDRHEEIKGSKEEEKREEVEKVKEEKWEEVEEAKEEKCEEVERLKEEEKREVEEAKEEKREELEGLKEEEKAEEEQEDKQEEVEGIKEGEKREEVEEPKEEKQGEVQELKEKEKREVEEEKEDKQKQIEEFEEEGNQEKQEASEEVKKEEKKEGEGEQVQSSHLEVQSEKTQNDISRPESESSEKEIQDENTKTEKTQTEEEKREKEKKQQEKVEEIEEEKKETEEIQQVNDVDRRDREDEESLKCSNELCPQATDEESVRDRDENVSEDGSSSADEGTIQTGNPKHPVLPERTGESQTIPTEGTDRDRIKQEEDGLEVDQIEDSDLPDSGENGLHGPSDETELDQTDEKREDGQLYPDKTENTELSNDKVLSQRESTKPEDTETSSNGISSEKKPEQIDSNHKTDTEEDINVRRNDNTDSQMNNHDDNTTGRESQREERLEPSASPNESLESQTVISEQTVPHVSKYPTGSSLPSDDHNKKAVETENGGAFGVFKNAFSFFSQTPVTETKDSTDSTLSLDTGETPQPQTSLTPEQELDSTTVSSQVDNQELHADSPVTVPVEQPQTPPSSDEIQTSAPSHPHTPSPNTETPLQTKTLSKYYKNLLTYMSVDEMTILMELFGRHKLQFLDYMLGSSDTVTVTDPDNDESILSDIERLLHYHRETVIAPSTRLADAPQEDKEKTRTVVALQKLEMLITRVRKTFNTGNSDTSKGSHQGHVKDQRDKDSSKTGDPSVALDNNIQRDEGMDVESEGQKPAKERETADDKRKQRDRGSEEESGPPASRPHNQPGSTQLLEGEMKQILDFIHWMAKESTTHVHAAMELLLWTTVQVVSSLPDDIRPGPDLYGVPWEPVIISSLVGLVTVLLFTCRCYSSVKSRMYRSKERWMAEQVAQLLDEKCKVLESLSKCQQEYDDLEDSLRDSGVLAQTQRTEHLEVKARQLELAKTELERDLEQLKDQLDQQSEHRIEQERRIALLEESMKTFEDETKDLQSQEVQAQTTLKVYNMNSDRLQRNLETAGEENTLLQESNTQLRQQVEGWAERVSELEAEMRRCEVAYSAMQQDVANKDERIMSLTDRLLRMKAWDSDLEEKEGDEGAEKETSNGSPGKEEENGKGDITDTPGHFQKVQKLIYAAKLNADLKSVDEDKDRVFAKLNDEVKAKEDLQESIKELENEKLSLQSSAEHYSDQVQRLQQKLQIMTEMYQENELKLHRLLTVEEKERLQKEEKLNKADKNIAMAMEELNNYRQRAEEMEEELEKTKQSYQTQISAREKKAHSNWLAARAADRELSDIRRENALLRQKLTDTQFKLDALDKDPFALDSLARPLPFRAERSPYGPSPLGRPASETRAFLSPPTLMDGPPARLSPRVCRGPVEPPGGQGEMERSGGPHSDSGSISPTWERDRRGPMPGPPGPPGPSGPLGPPGYMFPEPGGPMYRRPPPPPGALLPPPGSLPPGPPLPHPRGFPSAGPLGPPHPADMADGPYRENSLGPGEQEHTESGPGDRRTPPETDPRMGGPPPPGPPMGPMDGPFPRRPPYGPPPPDFYPPRGPGGPPMMPMWAPPPPGVMFPPRFPPGGPPLPPGPHPHYAPLMRPLPPDSLPPPSMGPPQQSLQSPPNSQSSPEEHRPSPEDAI